MGEMSPKPHGLPHVKPNQLRCEICNIGSMDQFSLDQHLAGKNHLKKVVKLENAKKELKEFKSDFVIQPERQFEDVQREPSTPVSTSNLSKSIHEDQNSSKRTGDMSKGDYSE